MIIQIENPIYEITKLLNGESEDEVKREEIYKNEGLVIYVKGKLVLGIHPDNIDNNLKGLINGDLKINWEVVSTYANGEDNE